MSQPAYTTVPRTRLMLQGIEEAKNAKLASSVAGGAVAITSAVAPTLLSASVAGPVGLAIAAAGLLAAYLFTPDLNGRQKIQASKIVDAAEPVLKQNLEAWNKEPHTRANQQAALQNFDFVWQKVVESCNTPGLATAGQNCIGDRRAGGKWDWFSYYRNPIANAATIDAATTARFLQAATQNTGLSSLELLALAAAVVLVIAL